MKTFFISSARRTGLLFFVLCAFCTQARGQGAASGEPVRDNESFLNRSAEASSVRHIESAPVREVVNLVEDRTDTIVRIKVSDISLFNDTLTTIVYAQDSALKQREDIVPVDSADRRGHYIEAYVGMGYGTLGYKLSGDDNRVNGSFSAMLQLQYAYFFHKNWGVGAGLWFTNYTSFAHLGGDYVWQGQTDSDTEQQYDHNTHINKWKERETIHNLGIPISLQTQWWNKSGDAGFFAALGIAPSFSVSKKYKLLDGELKHSGYYPNWHLTLEDMYEFRTVDYTDRDEAKGKLSVKPAIGLFIDLGALLKVAPQIDVFVGGYFNYTFNDVNNSDKKDLGWQTEDYAFMNKYEGAYATTIAGKSNPWEVGVKAGLHWRHIPKPKHIMVDYYDPFTRIDTTVTIVERYDTIVSERIDTILSPIQKAALKVEKFNKIYFNLDSYVLRQESKDYLNSMYYEVLSQVDDSVRISIQGHASKEGLKKHNEILAKRRAEAVANYLVDLGLDRSRIEVLSFGSLVENDENVNHQLPLDRRVEVKVITGEGDNKYSGTIEYKEKSKK